MHIKPQLFPYIFAALMLVGLCSPTVAQTRHSSDKCCGTTSEPVVRPLGEQLRNVSATELRSIVNEPVLRTYRLAIVVDYSYLMRHFSGDVGRAEAFCRRVGQELDRIYRRDIGIGFQLVLRPELIRRSSAEAVFGYSAGGQSSIGAIAIIDRSTAELNKLVGSDSYDIGLWLVNFWDYNGKASMSGGFAQTHKAAATISNDNIGTIAHELAHLFGAWHTASQNVDYSIHTEPEDGTSIMSYGFHDTDPSKLFFSLPSIQQIRTNLSRCGYYRNGDKQQLVPSKYEDYTNLPSAVEVAGMRPEAFALGSVAKSYTIPRGTSVRLAFASYSDAKDYLYNAHQNDRSSTTWTSRAKLEADYWQESPVVFLGLPQYNTYLDYTPEAADAKIGLPVGEYKVLAGAVERASAGAGEHKQSLDAVETQLRVVEGKPLRLTTNSDTRYLRAGEQLSLRWEADPSIFAGYDKVRIWLSDDYGKSYKYLLVDGTDNDGEHTITIPDISVGSVRALGNQEQGKAVFLLEIVGHVACATTAHYPLRHTTGGGFIIQSTTNTLQPYAYPYTERGGGTTPTPPSPQYHRVTLQQSEGGTLSIEHSDLTKVVAGTKLRVSVALNEGYELIELKAGDQDILSNREFVVQGDTEVRAIYRRVAPTTYRVSLVQSEGGTLSIEHSDLTKVVAGTKLRVSVALKEGYELIELKAGDQDILSSREFVVQGDTEVRATYRRVAPTTYRVSLIQSEGGTLSIEHSDLTKVVAGTKLRVSVTLNEGYELIELKAGDQDILSSREFVVQGNTEVRATYRRVAPTTYRVSLIQSEGGTLSIEHSDLTKVVAGTKLKVSVALKEGYELIELKAGEQDILSNREFVVQGNTEVRATYRRKAPTTYRVSLIQSEGGTLSIEHSDLTKVVAGTKLRVSVALKEGYELFELKAGDQDILSNREFVVQGDTEVRATYRRKAPTTYRVDLKQSEGGTLSIEHSDLTKVEAGTKLRVSVTLNEGYELIELKAGDQDILSNREFVVQGDTEVRATYRRVAPTTYRVDLQQSEGGTLSIEHSDLTKVVAGTKLKVSVTLKAGYELAELKAGEQDILSSREFVVQGNTEVRAAYRRVAPTTYRVSLIQSEGGTLSIEHSDLTKVEAGTKLKVSVALKEGYELAELKAGEQDILSNREFVVRGNIEVRATYRRVAPTTYRVDLKQSEGGTLNIEHSDLTKVVAGTKLKVLVTLKEGYELAELKAGDQDILSNREFVVQGDTEVRATYRRVAPTTYRVDLQQSEGGTLSIEHSDLTKVVAGTTLKVLVTLKEGYELAELKAGDQDILSSREFVVQGDTEVRATYRRVAVPVAPPVVPHEDDKPRLDAEVKVYPTVFTTELHISGYESLSHIELYSLSGHRLRRYAPQATLSVEGLPAGIYLVLLHSSKSGVRPQRFTVQKR